MSHHRNLALFIKRHVEQIVRGTATTALFLIYHQEIHIYPVLRNSLRDDVGDGASFGIDGGADRSEVWSPRGNGVRIGRGAPPLHVCRLRRHRFLLSLQWHLCHRA